MIDLDALNEQLIHNNCVVSLHIDIEKDSLKYNLLLTLSDSEKVDGDRLILYFYDVSNLQLSELGGGLAQFMHLNIARLNQGLDRMNYALTDQEHKKISFHFSSVDDIS